MRVFVTGSEGKIGSALVPALVERGHEVVRCDLKLGGGIFEPAILQQMEGCEAVVHLAAISYPQTEYSWADYFHLNCVGVDMVAEAAVALGVLRFVFTSSTSYYGAERGMDKFWGWPRWPVMEISPNAVQFLEVQEYELMTPSEQAALFYMCSKVIAEGILAAYGLRKALEVVILRLCPVSEEGVEYAWGLRLTLARAVRAIVAALEEAATGYEVFNVAEPDVDVVLTDKWDLFYGE